MVKIDRERCIGAGMCALTAPEVFDQSDDDGRVLVRRKSSGPGDAEKVRRAVRLCPSQALSLEAH